MQITVGNTIIKDEERNFKKGDKFPVLVRTEINGRYQYRVFFSEFVSVIVKGVGAGRFIPQTCSVYDTQYVVAVGESATLTFTQD